MDEEWWAGLCTAFANLMFLWAVVREYFPCQLITYVVKRASQLAGYLSPYAQITVPEFAAGRLTPNEAYASVEAYLNASCSHHARSLTADAGNGAAANLLLTVDAHSELSDDFRGAKLWWSSTKPTPDEQRSYRLTYHKRQRILVAGSYLTHVIKVGRELDGRSRRRQQRLYTNRPSCAGAWSHVAFDNPATFDTLAMDPGKKNDIVADLDAFRNGKDYYARAGKAWKRGYLLHGPPGTGKSTIIGAIANYLDYDVYDVDLTTVETNADLRRLLVETAKNSVIVVEDIDCLVELSRKVTRSGIMNFMDGLWSACGGGRLFVFTANNIDRLEPALIRSGRMDKHIEMSYCTFAAFRVLAANYLGVVEYSHPLFKTIERLMAERNISPADVAEILIPKTVDEDVESCLQSLVKVLSTVRIKEEQH